MTETRQWTTRSVMARLALIAAGGTVAGCVNITAPDKPIQINLNIAVTQQVVYKLDNDAKALIKQNPGIF